MPMGSLVTEKQRERSRKKGAGFTVPVSAALCVLNETDERRACSSVSRLINKDLPGALQMFGRELRR